MVNTLWTPVIRPQLTNPMCVSLLLVSKGLILKFES